MDRPARSATSPAKGSLPLDLLPNHLQPLELLPPTSLHDKIALRVSQFVGQGAQTLLHAIEEV